MRIVIANWHRTFIGGAEAYLSSLLPALTGRSHEIGFLHGYQNKPGEQLIDTHRSVDTWWCLESLGARETISAIRNWRPDVIYIHCLDSPELEEALLSAFPCVFFAHGYNGTCISGRKCTAFPSLQPCSRELGPACLAIYPLRRCGGLSPITAWNAYRTQIWRKRLLPRYASVLTASKHMKSEMERHGVFPANVQIAPLPVETLEGVRPRTSHQRRLLMMGRLLDVKGGSFLFEALPLAERLLGSRLSLRVAGTGMEQARLERMAAQKKLPVRFEGWLDSAKMRQLLHDSDLLIVPSVWPEPFGMVGTEAGRFGLPAAAFDVGGISDWLLPGYSGELAPGNPPTPQGLAEAIARALRDPTHYSVLSAGAIEVAGRFRMDTHLAILEQALERAAERQLHAVV